MTRLQTKFNRAIRAAVKAQTGYPKVSNVRLRAVVVPCPRCSRPLRFDDDGSIDCCADGKGREGCYSFGNWPSRRQELRHERRRRDRQRKADIAAGPWWIRYHRKDDPVMHWLINGRGRIVTSARVGEERDGFWRYVRGEAP